MAGVNLTKFGRKLCSASRDRLLTLVITCPLSYPTYGIVSKLSQDSAKEGWDFRELMQSSILIDIVIELFVLLVHFSYKYINSKSNPLFDHAT